MMDIINNVSMKKHFFNVKSIIVDEISDNTLMLCKICNQELCVNESQFICHNCNTVTIINN
mgnify:CR=1 FL=1|jgi:hypothetical protein